MLRLLIPVIIICSGCYFFEESMSDETSWALYGVGPGGGLPTVTYSSNVESCKGYGFVDAAGKQAEYKNKEELFIKAIRECRREHALAYKNENIYTFNNKHERCNFIGELGVNKSKLDKIVFFIIYYIDDVFTIDAYIYNSSDIFSEKSINEVRKQYIYSKANIKYSDGYEEKIVKEYESSLNDSNHTPE